MRVAYGRVSTQEQADVGGLKRQEKALLEACQSDELLLDVGSGTTTNRPEYQRLLKLIETGKVEQVLVKEQDRLNRNLQADLELWNLCAANGTRITDLHGREIEFRTPDGNLLSTVVSALNQHRSKSYALKTRQGIERNRKDGKPAVASVPFGIRKVFDGPQLVGLEVDPDKRKYAQERIAKFLELKTLNGTVNWINRNHPEGCKVEVSSLRRWLTHPHLTGRLCHGRDKKTEKFAYIAPEKSFEGLISDSTSERLHQLVANTRTRKGLAGRPARPLTGLCKCSKCGTTAVYKKTSAQYLRCGNAKCEVAYKTIREELVQLAVLCALGAAKETVAKMLAKPKEDTPAVRKLQDEVRTLENTGVSGVEGLIAEKKQQIAILRSRQASIAPKAIATALTHPNVWDQDDEWLNSFLRTFIDQITLNLAPKTKDSRVAAVRFKPEIGYEGMDPGTGPVDGAFTFMLAAQEMAVEADYKGASWEEQGRSFFPELKESIQSTRQYLAREGPDGELSEFCEHALKVSHGLLVHTKKIEPDLHKLWPELL